jgi:hypothetical protein
MRFCLMNNYEGTTDEQIYAGETYVVTFLAMLRLGEI